MREYELLLRLLAERVYTARLSTGRLRDASDFHPWLLECAEKAAQSTSVEELFSELDE
jgi:hypothetical protein